jgi:hypothetical protein
MVRSLNLHGLVDSQQHFLYLVLSLDGRKVCQEQRLADVAC